jgi:hypothetical protein
MKKTVLIVFLVFFFKGNLWSQTNSSSQKKAEMSLTVATLERNQSSSFSNNVNNARQFAPNGVVRCATSEYTKNKQSNGLIPSDEAFEAWLAPKINEIKRLRQIGRLPSVITIPVVVHVIHNGDAIGTNENIANGQVLSQIQVFNEDFRKIAGTPGDGLGVDTTIEFCLAQIDPNGNPTNGIDRRNLVTAAFNRAAVEAAKATTIWDPTRYLNMWTFNFGGDLASVLGYAQFPTGSGLQGMPTEDCITGEASTDGVVCAYSTWGSRTLFPTGNYGGTAYDKGRTMTHEVGHMFGLRHIWGDDGCPSGTTNVYTNEDFCADTPASAAPNFGCPAGTNSCPAVPGNDQIQNYMDYTDDACMSIFTQDQKDRMLAVLMNSPRRDDLLVSTVCNPIATPYIQFKRTVCESRTPKSVLEGNGCSYTEYTIPLNIDRAASQNATVTFAIDGASVANASDIQIMTPNVTFVSGSTADNNLVFRVLNDGVIEPDEELIISFSVNANGGDALANPNEGNLFKMTIANDDFAPALTQVVNLLTEDFENLTGWSLIDADADARNWAVVNGAGGLGTAPNTIVGRCAYSEKSRTYLGGTGSATPNNYLISPQITIPANATSASVSYIFAAFGADAGNYIVYFTTNATTAANITAGTTLQTSSTIANGTSILRTHDLSAFIGQTGHIVFRHTNNNATVGLLLLDNLIINSVVETSVQTEVNLATAYNTSLKSSGQIYARDSSTGRIMSGINASTGFDYGCTIVYVDRSNTSAGNPTSPFTDAIAANAILSKTFRVIPQNDSPTANYSISFYYTEAEVAAWETATGKSRNDLYVIKVANNPVSIVNQLNFATYSIESQPVIISSFGTNVVFQATFTSSLSGGFALGPQTIINCGDVTSTWNGTSWSNGLPYDKIVAVINGNYNTTTNGSLTCCSLSVDSGAVATIGANTHITVTGDISVSGTLNVLNNGSLVQIDDTAVNTGNISYERIVPIRKSDYVYWSSPINTFNVNGISPLTNTMFIFKWNPIIVNTNGSFGNWVSGSGETMVLGKGYIVKGPESFTSTAQNFTATFNNGVPNNGIITTSISRGNFTGINYNGTNGAQITRFDDNWNLIGNPYPSAIRALDFLNLNTNIEGAVRLWTHTSLPSSAISSPFYGTSPSNYTPADYITYNGLGTVSGPVGFNGYIAGGQGFFVQMNDGAAATQNITFNNALRSAAYANNQFYRNAQGEDNPSLAASRIWLDIVDNNNNSDRTLVGYAEGATAAKDRLFDAVTAAGLTMKIYSLLEDDLLTIQGKSYPIDTNDRVALGVSVVANGNYSIAIAALDGVASDLPIYLEDRLLNVIHDLRLAPYSFTATIGQSNDRFVLRYNNETLGNNDFVSDNEVMVISNDAIQITSNTNSISNVKIYNVLGQLLLDSNTINTNTFETSKIQKNNTALLVQVTLENGVKVTKKIVF